MGKTPQGPPKVPQGRTKHFTLKAVKRQCATNEGVDEPSMGRHPVKIDLWSTLSHFSCKALKIILCPKPRFTITVLGWDNGVSSIEPCDTTSRRFN